MMNKKINKRAGLFALGIIILAIAAGSTALYSFSENNKKIEKSFMMAILTDHIYNEADKILFYYQNAGKISLDYAFENIAAKGAANSQDCEISAANQVVIWNNDCKPSKAYIEKQFLEDFCKKLNEFVKKYPIEIKTFYTCSLSQDIVSAKAEDVSLDFNKITTYANYSFNYKFNPTIDINLKEENIYLEDFEDIYKKVSQKLSECKNQQDSISCIEQLDFERWQFSVEKQNLFFFNFKTKATKISSYDFKEIELKFNMA